MLDKTTISLINKDLDGLASAEELERLRVMCAGNEEARKFAEDLRALSRGLASMGHVAPPPSLRPAIMRSLLGGAVGVRRERHASLPEIWLRLRGNLRPAMLYAGGVATGLILFAAGSKVLAPGSLDENDLVGSLAVRGSAFSVGKIVEYKNGDLRAFVQIGTGVGQTIVRIRLDVPPGTMMVLAYPGGSGHVETVDVGKADQADISLEQGRVVVKGVSSGEIGVLFSGNGELLTGARLLFSDGYGGEQGIPLEGPPAR